MIDRTPPDDAATEPARPREPADPARWKAAAAAILLLVAGAALGVTVDRLWIAGAGQARATPLTVQEMARSLELGPRETSRVQEVLDSLEAELVEAARAGPDSLRVLARQARSRLHRALPPGARPEFSRWMQRHHQRMMERMHPEGRMPMDGGGHMRMHMREDSGQMGPGGMMRQGERGTGGRMPGVRR